MSKDQVDPLVAACAMRLGHDRWPDSECGMAAVDMNSHHWGWYIAEACQVVDQARIE